MHKVLILVIIVSAILGGIVFLKKPTINYSNPFTFPSNNPSIIFPTPIATSTAKPSLLPVKPLVPTPTSTPTSQSPTVKMIKPQDKERISGIVELLAEANSPAGITKVEFYIGSDYLLGTATQSPYKITIDTNKLRPGGATSYPDPLYTKAYDTQGTVTISPMINVYFNH